MAKFQTFIVALGESTLTVTVFSLVYAFLERLNIAPMIQINTYQDLTKYNESVIIYIMVLIAILTVMNLIFRRFSASSSSVGIPTSMTSTGEKHDTRQESPVVIDPNTVPIMDEPKSAF
jgi:hypothetical protein